MLTEQISYADNVRCLQIANEILCQIKAGIGLPAFFSWAPHDFKYLFHKDEHGINMPTLAMKVDGLLHSGWVYVSLNEGCDYYEIFLFDTYKKCIKHVCEVYFDVLGETLDSLIERDPKISDAEYRNQAHAHSLSKIFAYCGDESQK